jgi:antitoxin (DNA-binding transcriptional repressor) of toxin-antitoxin stability system
MQRVELENAKGQLPELVEQTLRGEEVVITKDDQPLVKLVAVTAPKRQRQFGSAKGLLTIGADFDAPVPEFVEYQ